MAKSSKRSRTPKKTTLRKRPSRRKGKAAGRISKQHRGSDAALASREDGQNAHEHEDEDEVREDLHESVAYEGDGEKRPFSDFEDQSSERDLAYGRGLAMLPVAALQEARAAVVESAGEEPEQMVDAWYADFGTAVSRALMMDPDSRGSIVAEIIQGADDRRRIEDTDDFPYRCICSLVITARNGAKWVGTGWLAGPRTVITAGHCVYIHQGGGWVRKVDVYPARDGTHKPLHFAANSFRSVVGWTRQKLPAYDYGAIILDEPVGERIGYFGYEALADDALRGALVNVIGYPGDKRRDEAGTLWWHARKLTGISSSQLFYDIDTFGGQSGAPAILWEKEERNGRQEDVYYVVGIHNYGDVSANKASRINGPTFRRIQEWAGEQ